MIARSKSSEEKPPGHHLAPLPYFVIWSKWSIALCKATSICHHVMRNITSVLRASSLRPLDQTWSGTVQAGKDPIVFDVPRPSFAFVRHPSSHLSQAICFKNGDSNNSLALGLFSWSISNVLLKNSWPSSLAFSGVVGFALEFPI